jgi:hypothetical protein
MKAKDLIQNMITKPSKRLTALQILNHPWMKTQHSKSNLKLNFSALKTFHNASKLKKAALTYIFSPLFFFFTLFQKGFELILIGFIIFFQIYLFFKKIDI